MTVLLCPLPLFRDIGVRFHRSGIPTHGPEYSGTPRINPVENQRYTTYAPPGTLYGAIPSLAPLGLTRLRRVTQEQV